MRKHCVVCGVEFAAKGKVKTCCKEHGLALRRQQARDWRARNLKHRRQQARDCRARNLEQVRQQAREWCARNREHVREKASRWRARHLVKRNCVICGVEFAAKGTAKTCCKDHGLVLRTLRARERRAKNPEKFRQQVYNYRARNLQKVRQRGRERNRERRTRNRNVIRTNCVICGVEFEAKKITDKTCCREHHLAWKRAYRQRNPEHGREYYARNQEKLSQRGRTQRARNIERSRQKELEWYRRNREKVLQRARKRHAENPEKLRHYQRKWYARNPERMAIKARKYRAGRRDIEQNVYLVFKEILGTTPEIEAMSPRRRRLAAFAFCKSIGLLPPTPTEERQ